MRAQMSFEMLLYMSLSGIAILFAAHMVAAGEPGFQKALGSYEASAFVQAINDNIAQGDFARPLQVQVPSGLCGASSQGGALQTQYGSFEFITDVEIGANVLCSPGAGQVELVGLNGTVQVVGA